MGSLSSLCTEAKDILAFAGWILTFFKIAIPLLIIGLGMFDFGKAVVSSKDDEIKKSAKTLMYRAIAGIVIFFVTSLLSDVNVIFLTDILLSAIALIGLFYSLGMLSHALKNCLSIITTMPGAMLGSLRYMSKFIGIVVTMIGTLIYKIYRKIKYGISLYD